MNHSLEKLLQQTPLSYQTPDGEIQSLQFNDDVVAVLSKESRRVEEITNMLENMQVAYKAWQDALKRQSQKEIEKTENYYTYITNKLLVLNTASPTTRHIKELIYGTAPYCYLTDENVSYLFDRHIVPILRNPWKPYKIKEFEHSLRKKLEEITKNNAEQVHPKSLEERRIKLSNESYLTREDLFNEEDDDSQLLIGNLEIFSQSLSSHPEVEKMEKLELLTYLLTEFPFFTFNLKRARDHQSSENYPLFYIGDDRQQMLSKRPDMY